MVDVLKVAEDLDSLANHFVESPWVLSEPTDRWDVKGLISQETIDQNKLWYRVKKAVSWLYKDSILKQMYSKEDDGYFWKYIIKAKTHMALYSLKKNWGYPDYTLRDGTVVTSWAETGDYLISVQPAVGDKVAKFLRENPDNPYAIEIAEEIHKAWTLAFPDMDEF